jgi:hypothetical protein
VEEVGQARHRRFLQPGQAATWAWHDFCVVAWLEGGFSRSTGGSEYLAEAGPKAASWGIELRQRVGGQVGKRSRGREHDFKAQLQNAPTSTQLPNWDVDNLMSWGRVEARVRERVEAELGMRETPY